MVPLHFTPIFDVIFIADCALWNHVNLKGTFQQISACMGREGGEGERDFKQRPHLVKYFDPVYTFISFYITFNSFATLYTGCDLITLMIAEL